MPPRLRSDQFAYLLLFLCGSLLYSGILYNDWHLDDTGNILYNTPIHITNLYPDTLFQTFYAHPERIETLYRPVANFTFALNWFFGQNSPVGYHLVDIFIHCLTAVMLYQSCRLLLNTPALKKQALLEEQKADIALLSAALWLCAPIHTSAVTYIVQRMAQLAALFSVSAIFFYLRARLAESRVQKIISLICFLCCALLALGSKENAVLLFPSILLIEGIFFFRFQQIFFFTKKNRRLFFIISFPVIIFILLFGWNFLADQSNNYEHRNFTFSERILTQPRILLFYLSQIFYPTASRLSIAHDIHLSASLFSPWQTFPAIACCVGLLVFALLKTYKIPIASFAIIYYFLNHLIESTVLPLELFFEHRNLLPSFFLFMPISVFIVTTINKKKWIAVVLAVFSTSFLIQAGLSTIERNRYWKNAGTLNEDAVRKAPRDARAKLNLAGWYIEQKRFKEAIALCEQAEQYAGKEASVNTTVPIASNLKGTIAYEQGNPKKAAEYFQQAYSLREDYTAVAEKLIATLIELKRYDEALAVIIERYQQKPDPKLLLLKASILLRQVKTTESIAAYRQARKHYPDLSLITVGQAKALIIMGHHDQAAKLLTWADQQHEPVVKLLQIENFFLAGENLKAVGLLDILIQTTPLVKLLEELDVAKKDAFQIPVDSKLLRQAILNTSIVYSNRMHENI